MKLTEKTLSSHPKYTGVIINVRVDQVELENGTIAPREVVSHPGGVAVLPLHGDGTVTLVEQYRYPFHTVLRELPAGKLDSGEDHKRCGLRELEEETGLVPGRFTYLGCLLLSPGYSDEVLHLYLAQDLKQGKQHTDPDEFLNLHRVPFGELCAQVLDGGIQDAKTVAAVLKTKLLLEL